MVKPFIHTMPTERCLKKLIATGEPSITTQMSVLLEQNDPLSENAEHSVPDLDGKTMKLPRSG